MDARRALTSRGLAHRFSETLGAPVAAALSRLPAGLEEWATRAAHRALRRSLTIALHTLDRRRHVRPAPSVRLHKRLAAGAGRVGGALGLPGLVLELPMTTLILLRSIADIARAEDEDLEDVGTRAAIIAVFALDSPVLGQGCLAVGRRPPRLRFEQA